MRCLSIDPSVNNVGWSIFTAGQKSKRDSWIWGTLKLTGGSLEMRIMDLVYQLDQLARPEGGADVGDMPDFLVTEKPTFFSSERGQIAAHSNYTIDLAAINYFIAGWFRYTHRNHFAITATHWKGSVSKLVTARRFFRDFPRVDPLTMSEHSVDAVMMNRFAIEQFIVHLPPSLLCSSPQDWTSFC